MTKHVDILVWIAQGAWRRRAILLGADDRCQIDKLHWQLGLFDLVPLRVGGRYCLLLGGERY